MQPGNPTERSCALPTRHRERGFTLIETAIAIVVFAVISVALVQHLALNFATTAGQKDSVHAYSKAQAILSEIQAYVDRGEIAAAIELDSLDDGVTNKPQLTISTDGIGNLVPPDHVISGNYQRHGQWVWSRRITVKRLAGLRNRNVRYVTVQIYKRNSRGVDQSLASISSVVNSVGSSFPTSQVYDLYLLAVENIPGWWVFMESIIPFVESAITDLESRNPGLVVRTHWITKASYGRSELYQPLVNDVDDSLVDKQFVYYYPGRMPAGSASQYYYVPHMIKARMLRDGVAANGYDPDVNPMPYALADWFNHAMRLPQERAFHDARVQLIRQRRLDIAAARRAGLVPPPAFTDMSEEPTLRLLYEDMNTDPDTYRNAWVINLHGELMPMPAMRNYSDAAKLPDQLPGVRVVSHPEELRTADTDDVYLRVYSYTTDLTYVTNRAAYLAAPESVAPKLMTADRPIAIEVPNVDLTDGIDGSTNGTNGLADDVEISGITGGTDRSGAAVPYSTDFVPMPPRHTLTALQQGSVMHYSIEYDRARRSTRILLYNSPVVAPWVQGPGAGQWRGTFPDRRGRLYGLDYVPACTEAGLDFSRNLATVGAVGDNAPRNTARWRIRLPVKLHSTNRFVLGSGVYFDPGKNVTLTFRTQIWDPAVGFGAGVSYPVAVQPDNMSETYAWWTESRDAVPVTERSQFLGDPRHNPYKDLYRGSLDFPDGYNWYHDSLANSGELSRNDYPGLDPNVLANRWMGRMRSDMPRLYQVARTALVNAGAVYTTLTGFSYYYMGLGGEIGYDSANGYPSSIPTNFMPWGGGTGSSGFINSITGYRYLVRQQSLPPYWFSIPWLGELYPDRVYTSNWLAAGNLPAGGGNFIQQTDQVVYQGSVQTSHGTSMLADRHIAASEGCTSFFNIGTPASTFHHQFVDGTSALVQAGLDLGSRYNFPMPATAPSNRPFRLDTNRDGGLGSEWYRPPYSTERFRAALVKTYYNHPTSGGTGSGLVELRDSGGLSSAYIVVNGISNAVASGSSFIAKYSVLTMVQSFLEGADPTFSNRIPQLPRVEITSPTEITELTQPTRVDIGFDVTWRRWDGQTYTSATPVGYTESENTLDYVVTYSRDNGATWLVCNRDVEVTPGELPTDPLLIQPDAGTGPELVRWAVPEASFPQGTYMVRVECYRRGLRLHYAQHQVRVFIQR